jgi:glycogen synthase
VRVLFLSQEFPPETNWGGIGTYAGIITRELARQGAEVHVLSVVAGQARSNRVVDGVHVHRSPLTRPRGVGRLLRIPDTWDRVSLAVAVLAEQRRLGLRFDVCESPEWMAEGLAVALRGRLPTVVRLHSGAAQIAPFLGNVGIDRRLAARCEAALIRRADIVTGTPSIVAEVASDLGLPDDQLRPINYPVDPKPSLPLPAGPGRVLFAGRLEHRKGADVLIKAVPKVLMHLPEARFVFLGADAGAPDGGSYRARMQSLVDDMGVSDAVEFRGRRGGPETVEEELRRATVCAVPSRWESMGYVAAEAAAVGRPVVASRIPALEAIVDDGVTGRLVPVGDVDSWAAAIVEVLSLAEERLRKMRDAARRLIADRCDPERIGIETFEAYREVISRPSASGADGRE